MKNGKRTQLLTVYRSGFTEESPVEKKAENKQEVPNSFAS